MDVKVDLMQDSIGQLCPMPIAFLAKNMRKMQVGQVLEIRADDEGAQADIPAWCEQTGNEYLGVESAGAYFRGSSTSNRGHEHHWEISALVALEGRPRRFGGVQRGKGTRYDNSSTTVQRWSVIPAAIAGVRETQRCRLPGK